MRRLGIAVGVVVVVVLLLAIGLSFLLDANRFKPALESALSKQLGRRVTVGKRPLVLESVNIDVKDFSSATQFPFSLSTKVAGGGDIKLDGKAGPIPAADTSMTPFDATLKINGLDLAASGLNSTAPDLAAIVSLDGTGASDGTTLKVTGHMKAERLKLAKNGTPSKVPVELDLEDRHALRK